MGVGDQGLHIVTPPTLLFGKTFCYTTGIRPQGSANGERGLNRKIGAIAFLRTPMRAKVYIDGYNFYYGYLKGHPERKWLDLSTFARALVKPGIDFVGVDYFTARIKTYPYDPGAVNRQNLYLRALAQLPDLTVHEGFYNKNKTWAPFVEEPCQGCTTFPGGMAHVMKLEEKRTDVNLTTTMLWDAFRDVADVFVLVSGDSDFIGPVDLIRHKLGGQVIVFNPHLGRRTDLARYATACKDIPEGLALDHQLPDTIPVGTHGNFIRRPEAWR